MTVLVLATANPDKASEMGALFENLGIAIRPRPPGLDDVEETSETLEGNALLKARAVATASGELAVADDTGLFVDALLGRPGVRSARYAGEGATYADNVQKLLGELREVDEPERTARFRTVLCVATPTGDWWSVEGVLEGVITRVRRGTGGFGYDPIFAPHELGGRTLAELGVEEKNAISHRGRALRALAEKLQG